MTRAAVGLVVSRIDELGERYRPGAGYLAALRIVYALWVLLAPTDFRWAAAVPEAFLSPPPGPFSLLAGLPPDWVLAVLQAAQALLALALLVGVRTGVVSVLLTTVMVTGRGIVYSFGKIDHDILFVLLPLAMAAAGWGAAYSVDARRGRPARTSGFPVLLWGLTVGVGLLSAALPKAATGWLDPARQATRGYLARDIADPARPGVLGQLVFGIDSDQFWKALDYGTVLVEAGLVVAVLWPVVLRLWLLAVLGFHVGVYLTLGISFAAYAVVYAPFFAAPAALALAAARARRTARAPGALPAATGTGEPGPVSSTAPG